MNRVESLSCFCRLLMEFKELLALVVITISAVLQVSTLPTFSDLAYVRIVENTRPLTQTPITIDIFDPKRVTVLLRPQLRNPVSLSIVIRPRRLKRGTIGTRDPTIGHDFLHQIHRQT